MISHWRIRTGPDRWFSKILWIRTGSDTISSDQDWTRTGKFYSPLISGHWNILRKLACITLYEVLAK